MVCIIPEVAVMMMMMMMVTVFWYVTPSSLLERYRCSEEYVTSVFRRGSAASCDVTVTHDMISGVFVVCGSMVFRAMNVVMFLSL